MESIDSVTCSVRTLKGSQCRRFVFWRASAEFSVWLSFLVLQKSGLGEVAFQPDSHTLGRVF